MLNRIANVVTFLTFGLLTAILGLGAVAIHDFNHRGNNIFVREWEQHANYTIGEIGGELIGYQVHYRACGQEGRESLKILQPNLLAGEVIADAEFPSLVYGRIEKREHIPFWTYHPISDEDIQRLDLRSLDKDLSRPDFEWGRSTRRVCQVNPAGTWNATRSLFRSLT